MWVDGVFFQSASARARFPNTVNPPTMIPFPVVSSACFFHIAVGIFLTPCSSCFVQFLADQFVSEPATHFQTGRTVMAKV